MKTCVKCGKTLANNFLKYCLNCKREVDRNRKKKNLICSVCGKEYFGFSNRKRKYKDVSFCSKSCGLTYRHSQTEINHYCEICGIGFHSKNSGQITCSEECRYEYSKRRKENKYSYNCDNCGNIFSRSFKKKGKSVSCCKECNLEYIRKNSKKDLKCIFCGKTFVVLKHENKKFCSNDCMIEHKKTLTGEKSPSWIKDIPREDRYIICQKCGKEFLFTNYARNREKPKFCSRKCAKFSIKTTLTKPHQMICDVLDNENISYDIELEVGSFSLDIIVDGQFPIEVMGTYWHYDPRKYIMDTDRKRNKTERDKRKKMFVENKLDKKILYIWEDDIISNIELCKKFILKYLSGKLDNFHSMNYHLSKTGRLIKNKTEIVPYFER